MLSVLLARVPTDTGSIIVLVICFSALIAMMIYFGFKMVEMAYVMRKKRPLYTHFYLRLRRLTPAQKQILESAFPFYTKLNARQQCYFEHRVASFIKDKFFIPRENLEITDAMRVLISATAVMLTFGFRDFYIGLIDKIFIYPSTFYSTTRDADHNGELNPQLKALVLSWEHFLKGYEQPHDNINLGIHEFSHAIHLNSIKEKDVSSTIFGDAYKDLIKELSTNTDLRQNLIASRLVRSYAYTNQFEFIAAIIETFIESPTALKSKFPELYAHVRRMLNFNFAGY